MIKYLLLITKDSLSFVKIRKKFKTYFFRPFPNFHDFSKKYN